MAHDFRLLPINALTPGRYQPRKDFDLQKLSELSESIISQGLIEPLVVREISSQFYEIIAGERRFRAAQMAGLQQLPCVVGAYTDKQALAVGLIENIQRQDLNLIEEAIAYQRLLTEFSYVQEDIARLVGKSRSHIANILRLLQLSNKVQDLIAEGSLSLGHARMLVGLSPARQEEVALLIIEKDMTVRALEAYVRDLKDNSNPPLSPKKDKDVKRLTELLSMQVGAPVDILSEHDGSGWLKIKFFNNDTLAGLLEKFGLLYDIEEE